jgi:hypothetical protein
LLLDYTISFPCTIRLHCTICHLNECIFEETLYPQLSETGLLLPIGKQIIKIVLKFSWHRVKTMVFQDRSLCYLNIILLLPQLKNVGRKQLYLYGSQQSRLRSKCQQHSYFSLSHCIVAIFLWRRGSFRLEMRWISQSNCSKIFCGETMAAACIWAQQEHTSYAENEGRSCCVTVRLSH